MAWLRRSRDREQIRPLVELTGQLLMGEIDAASYDERFRGLFHLADGLDEQAWLILDTLFVECDCYVEDPSLRDQPIDLDEEGLRAAAVRALVRLALV
ncbi:colicin immunity domain-containing protein [Nocardioides sp. InS609-2]|uniref:colicin immunity domain-containing protein n=1 Tax=Nocardioides sp. InS609-2 TaxID=2760705 RepID=UPI0020BE89FC|nr:colicin immunity domain-containing protein [Nocardioides sp. InS609-2]